jgi:hypothetical protein
MIKIHGFKRVNNNGKKIQEFSYLHLGFGWCKPCVNMRAWVGFVFYPCYSQE